MKLKKFMQKKLKNEKGMTLIELLAVIVILAIIAAIAIPAIGNIIENSRVGAVKSDYINALAATDLYLLDYPADTTVTLENLTGTDDAGDPIEVYLSDTGSLDLFTYLPASKTFTGEATANNVTLDAAAGTSKGDISGIANSAEAGPYGTVTLGR
ncbi:prepilin-type N-terminal cleavage/methylation domain-containing protein [Planococcus sp. X10-3]|uniref:prepilin-type N-terminal cleavage/methylation domain-containing protein n=1 Tax=Planococcus sp. X10-3 TaxID=3061240 RepID=UPI003BAE320E